MVSVEFREDTVIWKPRHVLMPDPKTVSVLELIRRSPEWARLRWVVMETLRGYPEALEAVKRGLDEELEDASRDDGE